MTFLHRKTIKHAFFGVVTALILTITAQAQSSVGHITGRAIAGDTVVIQGVDSGFNRELDIKKDGKYQIRSVPPGSYNVTVAHADGTIDPVKLRATALGSPFRGNDELNRALSERTFRIIDMENSAHRPSASGPPPPSLSAA